jgi:multisubunit Na+/H+ antiporter MnhB subunit
MDDYIIQNAQEETGSNNVVTSVVFDYRGFDTLGEATILFTAVTGVLLLLRTEKRRKEGS